MHVREAAELRSKWGDIPCSHPHIVAEVSRHGKTGDYACTTCGEVGWGKNWPEEERKRQTEQK